MKTANAADIEEDVVEELASYPSLVLLDTAGHALNERALAKDTASTAKLIEEGIEQLLKVHYKEAIRRLDQAIQNFEQELTSLRDHQMLHEALLAKAEAQFQSGQKHAAKKTLKRLAALKPKKQPNTQTHPPKFVALWREAITEVEGRGGQSVIEIETNPKTAGVAIQVDGEVLGEAPVKSAPLLPGKHYVVARWPSQTVMRTVKVPANQTTHVIVERETMGADPRRDLFKTIQQRLGLGRAEVAAHNLARQAHATGVLIAGVRPGGESGPVFILSRHDSEGSLIAIGQMTLQEKIAGRAESNIKRLPAAIFVDQRRGEFEVLANGQIREANGVAALLFGRPGERPPEPVVQKEPEPGPTPGGGSGSEPGKGFVETAPHEGRDGGINLMPDSGTPASGTEVADKPPTAGTDDDSLTSQWWFWALVGAAAAGIGGAYLATRKDPNATSVRILYPPPDQR